MPDHTADQQPELLTIAEAAELLRTPVATLRYWRHRNTGPRSFRLGRRVLYRRDDLHGWIEDQRAEELPGRGRAFRSAVKSTVTPSRARSDETDSAET